MMSASPVFCRRSNRQPCYFTRTGGKKERPTHLAQVVAQLNARLAIDLRQLDNNVEGFGLFAG